MSVYSNVKLISNYPVPEDITGLVKQARLGTEAAFSELYDLYFQKIYKFTFYRVGHKETAEDITEEVFLKAYKSLSGLKNDSLFESWLYQIARNKVIDYYRSKKIVVAIDELENTLEYETNIIDIVNLGFDQKALIELIRELTPEQQVIIKLKFYEDLDNTTIAEILEKEEGTIRVIQHRAITKLKELFNLSKKS